MKLNPFSVGLLFLNSDMKLAKDYPRRVAATLWFASSCIFLWFFSLAAIEQLSLSGFFHFSFMLIGGGASYHLFTELLTIRYNHQTKRAWHKLMIRMALLMGTLLTVAGLVIFDKYMWPRSGLLALCSVLFGYIALWPQIPRIVGQFNALRSNNSSKRTRKKPRAD